MQTHAEFLRLLVVLLPFVLVIGGLGIGLILYYLRQYRLMKLLRNKYLDDLEKERQRISMELHDLYGPFSMQIRTR
ncbi:MAG TPA: hypothetical protein P5248_05940, partial [Bacteroidales bacterium]|nr:hypothetical protein [Bacteroidales bacterium]